MEHSVLTRDFRPSIASAAASILVTLFALGAPAVGEAHAAPPLTYPRLALYTNAVGAMSSAALDTIARYDLVALNEPPHRIRALRQRNPEIELFYIWMPQNFVGWNENSTTWHPDTTWSLIRLCQFYAQKNDWYLRDTNGERIPEWDGYAANWTRHCPRGTYGTSRGLTYVEWLVQEALPSFTGGSEVHPAMGWDGQGYQGLILEVLVDCVGSIGWERYANADPDQNGVADGVYGFCSQGGADDPLSVLYREQNELFHQRFWDAVGHETPVVLSGRNPYINPAWWTDVTGYKFEGWVHRPEEPWQDWRDFFYGLHDSSGREFWGPGYQWAEWEAGHLGNDPREGWDTSLLQIFVKPQDSKPQDSEAERQRVKRLGFATTLLGNGYFMYTSDQQPEYDWEFGEALGPFRREPFGGLGFRTDTLYVREFEHGFVEVNPNARPVRGIAPFDARFGFWNNVATLRARAAGRSKVWIDFRVPGGLAQPAADGYELRYAMFPIDLETWKYATPVPGGPLQSPAGQGVFLEVTGLYARTDYWFALRSTSNGRLSPILSNVARTKTKKEQILEDPADVDDALLPLAPPMLSLAPNPSAGQVTVRLALSRPAAGRIEILDASGRRVHSLAGEDSRGAGAHVFTWDGRLADRTPAPGGVYWVRFVGTGESADRSATARLVHVR